MIVFIAETPTMKGVFPTYEEPTVNSLTLKWSSWGQNIGMGFTLVYSIIYYEYDCQGDGCEIQGIFSFFVLIVYL